MASLAFLGLGAMGSRMAANLLRAGHSLTVWNRDAGKADALCALGARVGSTPRDAVAGTEIVLAMLRDDDASRSVWADPDLGALSGMKPGSVAVECSTLSLAHVAWLAGEAARVGVGLVDAPLAGSRPQAEARELAFFAGGQETDVARIKPVLLDLGSAIHCAGASGSGMAIKLAVNGLFAAQVATMAEIVEMLARSGLDPLGALSIMAGTPVCSPAARVAGEMMVRGAFAPMFPVDLVEKDLAYAIEAAGGRARAPLIDATRGQFLAAAARGHGSEHITAVVRNIRAL